MVFLHINPKNYNKKNYKTKKTPIEELNHALIHNKNVFLLIYMEDCGPCNATRPEWSKIKNVMKDTKNNDNIFIVDIDRELIDKIKTKSPRGFPTMRYIKGKEEEDFEDSIVGDKERKVDPFVEWIELKTSGQKGGVTAKTRKNRKSNGSRKTIMRRNKKCVKWSVKYKHNISRGRPKGIKTIL